MPLLISYADFIRWDDSNHTDRPIGTLNIVSGQSDYTISSDDNSLDILNITNVRILESATGTEYVTLERMQMNDERVLDAMSPNPTVTGIPTHFVENENGIFLWPEPNYNATNGIKVFFSREQSYFTSSDTTKEPGIPKPFHELLAFYAAQDWILVNRPDDSATINALEKKILRSEKDLKNMIAMRNPTKIVMTMKKISYI